MKYFSFLLFISLASNAQKTFLLELKSPPPTPVLLAEGSISSHINERDFALSPDGNEIYYTISTPKSSFQTIVFSKKQKDNKWSAPEVATFAGTYSDLEPAFSADGNALYFSSNRPVTGKASKDFDIWKVTRTDRGWSEPQNLGAPVNTEADEFYPSITASGNLYFTAAYKGGVGKEDIYVSSFVNRQYQKPVVLDTAVNSKLWEFNAFVSPDERFILFTSYGRKDDSGGGDLYISVKDNSGKWKPAQNLKELNSKQLDYCPFVSPDGKILFFTSERHLLPSTFSARASYKDIANSISQPLNGTGNIYWMDFHQLDSFFR